MSCSNNITPCGCESNPCGCKTSTDEIVYNGPNLECTGIQTCDTLTDSIKTISEYLCSIDLVQVIINNITNNISLYNQFTTIVNNTVDCETVWDCINTTTTTTTTLPIIIPECSTFTVHGNTVSFYDFETNSFVNLFSEGFGSWNDVANTNNKLWISNLARIKEYDITLNPWSVNFNRDIEIGSGPGLTAVDNNSLIGSIGNKLILIDISGITPTYIEIATIPSFSSPYPSSISGDIMLTNNNKLICTVQTYTEGSPDYYYTRLLQYDYPTMNLELVINLYPTVNGPFGLTENDGNIYIFDATLSNKLFSISTTYPYIISEVDVLSNQVNGASVEKSCVTSSFITTTTTTTVLGQLIIKNDTEDSQIESLSVQSGTFTYTNIFPVLAGDVSTGTHGITTAALVVGLVIVGSKNLSLFINDLSVETLTFVSSGLNSFLPVVILPTDKVEIVLTDVI